MSMSNVNALSVVLELGPDEGCLEAKPYTAYPLV